jgi:DNA-binding MarR family transcriptional regulator
MAKQISSSRDRRAGPDRPAHPDREQPRDVADRLHSAAIHLLRRLRRVDAAMGITAARASALSVLVFGGPKSIGELATLEQVSAPTMTKMVSGMEGEGLVRREADPRDGRAVRVIATPRGATILRKGRDARVHELATVLERLPPDQIATLSRAADILVALERT